MKDIATDKQLDMFRGTEEIMNDSTIEASSCVSTELRQMDASAKSTELLNASKGVTSDLKKFEDCSDTLQNLKDSAYYNTRQ